MGSVHELGVMVVMAACSGLFWKVVLWCRNWSLGGMGVDLLNYESIWGQSMNCVSNFLSGSLF